MTATTLPPDQAAPMLLDARSVAHLLDCSVRHVARLTDSGKMPAPLKIGRLLRWPRRTIENWIADGCPPVERERRD
jgi:excisionase family DNA binding protein